MFGSSNKTSSAAPRLFTGLNNFKVVGLNPSKEEIENYLGREYKLNVNYDIVDLNGRSLRPIEIWLKDTSDHMETLPIRFYMSDTDDVSQSGTIRFVNSKGNFASAKSEELLRENEKMSWFTQYPFRVAKLGEFELYTFMQKLMRYNSRGENAAFMDDAVKLEITPEQIFNNRLKGLHEFFNWCNENNNTIVLLSAVRSTSKIVDGDEKLYYNQTLVNNPNFYFASSTGTISSYTIKAVKDAIDKGERISKFMFTVEFQPFVKENCINAIPEETKSTHQETYNASNLL